MVTKCVRLQSKCANGRVDKMLKQLLNLSKEHKEESLHYCCLFSVFNDIKIKSHRNKKKKIWYICRWNDNMQNVSNYYSWVKSPWALIKLLSLLLCLKTSVLVKRKKSSTYRGNSKNWVIGMRSKGKKKRVGWVDAEILKHLIV